VLVLVGPLNQVIQPRLTILAQLGDEVTLTYLYRLVSQFAVVGFVALGGGLAFFAQPLLCIWSGNEVAADAAPILFWYALANALVGVLGVPFMLQFARGKLRVHVIGNVLLLLTLVPGLVLAAQRWGAVGAGKVYFAANLAFLVLWVPLAHRYVLPVMVWRWSFRDILPTALVMAVALSAGARLLPGGLSLLATLAFVVSVVLVSVLIGVASGSLARPVSLRWLRQGRAHG